MCTLNVHLNYLFLFSLQELKSKCQREKEEFDEAKSLYEEYRYTVEESNRKKAPVQVRFTVEWAF